MTDKKASGARVSASANASNVDGIQLTEVDKCLRGLSGVLQPAYEYLSPTIGFSVSQSMYINTIYHRGWPDSPLTKLVKVLYHSAALTETVRPTRNKSKPAYFLRNPERLGTLVGLLVTQKLRNPKDAATVELLQPWQEESRCSKKSLAELLELVHSCHLHCKNNREFFPHTALAVLLAFLWQTSDTVDQLRTFLRAVNSCFSRSIFAQTFDAAMRNETSIEAALKCHYAKIVSRGFPLVLWGSCVYKGHSRPDCVEAAVRNIINFIVYDHNSGRIDLERLRKLAPIPSVLQFYDGSASGCVGSQTEVASKRHSSDANLWFGLMADHQDVVYISNTSSGHRYEVYPTLGNVLLLMERLFVRTFSSWVAFQRFVNDRLWPCDNSFRVVALGEEQTLHFERRHEVTGERVPLTFQCQAGPLHMVRTSKDPAVEVGHDVAQAVRKFRDQMTAEGSITPINAHTPWTYAMLARYKPQHFGNSSPRMLLHAILCSADLEVLKSCCAETTPTQREQWANQSHELRHFFTACVRIETVPVRTS